MSTREWRADDPILPERVESGTEKWVFAPAVADANGPTLAEVEGAAAAIPAFDATDPRHVAAIRSMLNDPWAERAYDLTNVAASLRCSPTMEAVIAALDALEGES